MINSKWCKNIERKEVKIPQHFILAHLKIHWETFVALFCQLRTLTIFLSAATKRDWCVYERKRRRKIIRREGRYEKRLSGGTRSYTHFFPFFTGMIKCFVICLEETNLLFYALKNGLQWNVIPFTSVSKRARWNINKKKTVVDKRLGMKNGVESGSERKSPKNCNLKFICQINFMWNCIAVGSVRAKRKTHFLLPFFLLKRAWGGGVEVAKKNLCHL